MKLRWSHAVLYVRDAEAMVAFWRDVLGFQVTDRGRIGPEATGPEVVFLSQDGDDHHQIAFAAVRGDGPSTTLDHMAFRVANFTELKEMAARVQGDGRATELNPVNHGNAWSVYFKDPEGNGIEIFCDSPFHVAQPQLKSWDLAMTEDELRARTEAEFGAEAGFQSKATFTAALHKRLGD
jgi:catechol 2,3-dioxygenase